MIKLLFVCGACGEAHKMDATCLIVIKPDTNVTIVGKDELTNEQKLVLGKGLPWMLANMSMPGSIEG